MSVTPGGTASIIFCKMAEQIFRKSSGLAMALTVAFWSDANTLASAFLPFVVDCPTTKGFVVVLSRYSVTTLLSNIATVESRPASPSGALAGTISGNSDR